MESEVDGWRWVESQWVTHSKHYNVTVTYLTFVASSMVKPADFHKIYLRADESPFHVRESAVSHIVFPFECLTQNN